MLCNLYAINGFLLNIIKLFGMLNKMNHVRSVRFLI